MPTDVQVCGVPASLDGQLPFTVGSHCEIDDGRHTAVKLLARKQLYWSRHGSAPALSVHSARHAGVAPGTQVPALLGHSGSIPVMGSFFVGSHAELQ